MKKLELPYSVFARYYDALTAHFQRSRCKQLYNIANKYKCNSLCDYACGTGILLKYFHDRGIDVFGCDISKEMITIASKRLGIKVKENTALSIVDMIKFCPVTSTDMASCCFDSINYLTTIDQWKLFFKNVFNGLNPGGIFVFDFITEHDLIHNWPGYSQIIKRINWICIRLVSYNSSKKIGYEQLHWMIYNDKMWRYKTEIHEHVSFAPEKIRKMLLNAGFIGEIMRDFDSGKKIEKNKTIRIEVIARKRGG